MFNVNMYFIHEGFPFIVSQGGLVTHTGDWEIRSDLVVVLCSHYFTNPTQGVTWHGMLCNYLL